jgi:hypothetical protein
VRIVHEEWARGAISGDPALRAQAAAPGRLTLGCCLAGPGFVGNPGPGLGQAEVRIRRPSASNVARRAALTSESRAWYEEEVASGW